MFGNSKKVTRVELVEALQASVSNDSQLVLLETKDYDEMINVLSEAFLEDPLATWVAGLNEGASDETKKRELQVKSNECMNAWTNRPILVRKKGAALGIKDSAGVFLAGVMTLVPGHTKTDGFWDIVTTLIAAGSPPFMTKEKINYGVHADKRLVSLEALTKRKMKLMKDETRYIYVQTLGVMSEHQGKGYGGKLLRKILDIADSMGAILYLETESKSNEALYHHFGFETVETMDLQGKGDTTNAKLTMWLMLRRPKVLRA